MKNNFKITSFYLKIIDDSNFSTLLRTEIKYDDNK